MAELFQKELNYKGNKCKDKLSGRKDCSNVNIKKSKEKLDPKNEDVRYYRILNGNPKIGNTIQELYVKELEIHKVLRHYLYVRKKKKTKARIPQRISRR